LTAEPRRTPEAGGPLQRLHHGPGILLLRFAYQQMSVFGHDYVADDDELIAFAHLFHHRQKKVTAARGAEQRLAPITTASNET